MVSGIVDPIKHTTSSSAKLKDELLHLAWHEPL